MNPLSTKMNGNTLITKFNEFHYFTSVSTLGINSFVGCTNLVEIDFPTSLRTIGSYSSIGVMNRTALVNIDLKNVTTAYIGFTDCTSLLRVNAKYLQLTYGTFNGCTKLKRVIVPNLTNNNSSANGFNSFRNCSNLELVDIGMNLNRMGNLAFNSSGKAVVVIRSKSFTTTNNTSLSAAKRIYCYSEMYDYLTTSSHNSSPGKVYLIGGEQWIADFGSSDVWADLTQEEYDYYYKDIVEQGSGQS